MIVLPVWPGAVVFAVVAAVCGVFVVADEAQHLDLHEIERLVFEACTQYPGDSDRDTESRARMLKRRGLPEEIGTADGPRLRAIAKAHAARCWGDPRGALPCRSAAP